MAITIRHERADQRRHLWVHVPIPAEIDGVRYLAEAWSMAGLAVRGRPQAHLAVGKNVKLRVTVPFQGYDVSFNTTGVVEPGAVEAADIVVPNVETLPAGTLVIRFDALTARDRELLSHFVGDIVTGDMAPVETTLRRVDVPVQPTSLVAHDAGVRATPVTRSLRTVFMSGLYGALGLGAFGYLAALAYTSFAWQEAGPAIVHANATAIEAPADGQFQFGKLKPGDRVKAGDVVGRIVDLRLDRDLELADLAVREREARRYAVQAQADRLRRTDLQLRAREDLRVATTRQRQLQDQRAALSVVAPVDGIIAEWTRPDKTAVRRGDHVARLQTSAERDVVALLSLTEADRIRVDGRAVVRSPGESVTHDGRVVEIFPASRMVHVAGIGASTTGSVQRPIAARITLASDAENGRITSLRAGQPVLVMLERQSAKQVSDAGQRLMTGFKIRVAEISTRLATLAGGSPVDMSPTIAEQKPTRVAAADQEKSASWLMRWLGL